MPILKVPTDAAVSPEDGSPLRLDTETHVFTDVAGNEFSADDLARGRPANKLRKWLRENYPKGA